jgi:tetratricopeptide (TPR) repeat protein
MQAFSEASQRLHHIRREYKENTFVRMHFGLLFSLGHYEDALQVLNEAREEGFTSSPALYYQVLHALRRHDEAWAIVRPDLEDVTPEIRDDRVESLVGAGIQFYVRGDADVARIVFAQLLQVSPDNPRLLNNLGFIALGERNLSRAEAYLTKALEASEPDWQTVVALNIGYLRLLQQDYAQAEEALALAEARVEGEEGSIPLIAYWRNGEVLPEYTPYPRVFYPIELSIWANRVTLDLALEDPEAAETLARRIVEVAPNLSVGYRVLGWALVAQSRLDEARSTWETALPYAREDAERQALQQWLADFS